MTVRAIAAAASALFLGLGLAHPALADDAGDIRARLEAWTDDFNARRVEPVCGLFSEELVSTVRTQGERDYAFRCDQLTRALTDPTLGYHQELEIHEIVVEGDLAIARLTATLFISPLNVTSVEQRMDVFRREADGAWRIVRYIAYAEEQ
jgi:steroid delta-isomerase